MDFIDFSDSTTLFYLVPIIAIAAYLFLSFYGESGE